MHAQGKEDYQYFLDKAIGSIYNNPDSGLKLTQDLMMNDKKEDRLFYQHIEAQSYALQGDYVNAAKSVFDKEETLSKDHTAFHQFFLIFCVADQYQNIGLYEQSQKVITKLLKEGDFPDDPQKDLTLAKIYQLQAINFAILKKYDIALENLEKSNALIHSESQEIYILKTENQLLKGISYLNQKKISDAEQAMQLVLNDKKLPKYAFLQALALENMARVRFMQQRYAESIELLHQAESQIKGLNYGVLDLKIYEGLSKAYLATDNNAEFKANREQYESLKQKIDDNQKSATSYLVGILEDVNNKEVSFYESQSASTTNYIVFSAIFLLLLSGGVYYYVQRKEKELQKQVSFFNNYFEKIKAKTAHQNQVAAVKTAQEKVVETKSESAPPVKKTSLLSPEKEQELIDKLEDFENSELFLSKQMSLPLLASELETNIKYLSEVIKTHKEKKFNSYINDLRIRHIINLLKTDPAYLNYKVSYLAEISGFSSHSAFTAVFKSITGMSPNDFIQQINTQKKA